MLLGAVLAIVLLDAARKRINLGTDELAFGRDTETVLAKANGHHIHCQDATDSRPCRTDYEAAGRPPAALWLGNSQLHAINRYKTGDKGAATLLHERLSQRGLYLTAHSQPNANLIEHALIYHALSGVYDLRLLILPVFLDKIREQGVRPTIAQFLDEPQARKRLEQSGIWPHVAPNLKSAGGAQAGEEGSAEPATFQQRFEARLDKAIGSVSPLWAARPVLRGYAGIVLYHLRNKLLGINNATKRRVDDGVYREKMAVLDALLADAAARKIRVLVYVPPYRDDIDGPYLASDYTRLKADLAVIARRNGADFTDIDKVVPGPEWATVVDPVLGVEDNDFMHFSADGHRRHAEALDAFLRRIGQ